MCVTSVVGVCHFCCWCVSLLLLLYITALSSSKRTQWVSSVLLCVVECVVCGPFCACFRSILSSTLLLCVAAG